MIVRKKRKTKKQRTRIDPRFWIIIGALAAVIGVLLFILIYNGREDVTGRGAMMFSVAGKSAVIIRDEETYLSSEYARVACNMEEGAAVNAGDSLATVYKLGYSDELSQSLLMAREEVYKAQLERIGSTKDSRLDEMNEEILSLKTRIENCVMQNSGEDLLKLYRSLDKLLKERMDYLREKVQETESLRALYAQVDDKEALLSTWTEDVTAKESGLVSYYFDGYEQAMNAEKLNMITADLVKRAISESGSAHWTTDDNTRVCRVVNRDKWYVAFITDAEELTRTAKGVSYDVEIDGHGKYAAVALEPVISGKKVVNVLEVSSEIGELIDVRSVKVNVTSAVNGIKVKSKAVRFNNGEAYVELIMSDSHYTMRVDVLAAEDKMVLIRPHEEGEILSEGVRYWIKKR